ncbi:MAG TPA: NINE protein [Pirellulaceae bacterium]|nr:NINE protein [Pirellulaceae bacterium]
MSTAGGRGKNKLVAALLALFLGSLGVHHFYLGSSMAGVVTIVACCGLFSLLPLIEAIMLFIMSDAEFDAKYNARTPEPMEFVFQKK